MPRRAPLRTAARRLALTAVGLTLAGCQGAPLHIAVPRPANDAVPVCNQLNDRLPNLLERLQSRPTRPRSPLVHAWGNTHPVVLRCGVPVPAGYTASSSRTALVNGVTWFQQVQDKQVVWTAVRKNVNIELTIPTHYQGQGAFLVDIGEAIAATIP